MNPASDCAEGLGPVRTVEMADDAYPESLRTIADPPGSLWLIGSLPTQPCVAVVGTRTPTDLGLEATTQTVAALASRGAGVVAGLSPGIDQAAHAAALDHGLVTWAFVSGGPDLRQSSTDLGLAGRMIAGGGGVIAEVPPGTPDTEAGREKRDRLQTATSSLTVVVQAERQSGTRHTARFALEQSRPLVVVQPPASEADHPSWGLNAALFDEATDVIEPRAVGNVFAAVVL